VTNHVTWLVKARAGRVIDPIYNNADEYFSRAYLRVL
jgi:hypothetical protein